MNSTKKYDAFIILYYVVILLFLTLSYKVPKIAQHWPLLYPGIILLGFSSLIFIFKISQKKRIVIYGGWTLSIYLFLVCYIFIDFNINGASRNAIALRIIICHIFPFLIVFNNKFNSLHKILNIFARTIIIFSLINLIFAWYFQFGGSFELFGIIFKLNIYYVDYGLPRLHGIIGEPTHFGLLMGISLLSIIYLHRRNQELKVLKSKKNRFFYGLVSLFFILSLIFSGTRSAMISTIISLMAYSYYDRKVKKIIYNLFSRFFLLTLLLVILFVFFQPEFILPKLRLNSEGSNSERVIGIFKNLQILNNFNLKEWIFGLGYTESSKIPTAWNQYIEMIRTFGLIWFFMGSFLIILIVKRFLIFKKINYNIMAFPFSIVLYTLTCCMVYTPLDNTFNIVTFSFVFVIAFYIKTFDKRLIT